MYEKYKQEKKKTRNKENMNSTAISGVSTFMRGTKSSAMKQNLGDRVTPRNTSASRLGWMGPAVTEQSLTPRSIRPSGSNQNLMNVQEAVIKNLQTKVKQLKSELTNVETKYTSSQLQN